MAIQSYQIGSANTNYTVYTSTTSGSQIGNALTTMIICNTSSSTTATVTMYAVTNGSSASTTNMIINALSIPGGETVSLDQEKLVLGSGDFIVASCNQANLLSITVSTIPV
jgi:hypothetical protein